MGLEGPNHFHVPNRGITGIMSHTKNIFSIGGHDKMINVWREQRVWCEERGDEEKQKRGKTAPFIYKNPSPTEDTLNPDDLIPYTLKHDQLFHI
jgi:hypothetical protein